MLRLSVQMDPRPRDIRNSDLVILRLRGPPLRLHSPVRSGESHPPDVLSHLLCSVCREYQLQASSKQTVKFAKIRARTGEQYGRGRGTSPRSSP